MSSIPGGPRVRKTLHAAKRAVKASLKETNQQAGKQLSKGNYARAEALIETARAVDGFEKELDGLMTRWKNLGGASSDTGEQTPLWEYYQPILRALERVGGSAATAELLREVEREMGGHFRPGDHALMARDQLRWQVMVRRAKKPMKKEGFIEADASRWIITSAGRRAVSGKAR
jgi:hypothetical protein